MKRENMKPDKRIEHLAKFPDDRSITAGLWNGRGYHACAALDTLDTFSVLHYVSKFII